MRTGEHWQSHHLYLPGVNDAYQSSASQSSSSPSSISQGSSSSSSSSAISPQNLGCSRRSRNIRVPTNQVPSTLHKISLCQGKRGKSPDDLSCPVEGCSHEQTNGRLPDLRRHILTHVGTEVRCIGVPWDLRHLFPCVSRNYEPYVVGELGGLWVGGCLGTFSRPDALRRHLKKSSCVALTHTRRNRRR